MSELISVLMPVYNREKFLHRSILSILEQSHKNIQFIIYNDGSTDKSRGIVEMFIYGDQRIKLINNDINKGVGHARNQLLKACNTKYAIWQDSDDRSHINRITFQYDEMVDDRLIFCGWKNLATGVGGEGLGFATLMFPVNKTVLFNESMMFGGEDWDWIERMRKTYNECMLRKILYSIDFHDNRIGTWKRKICKEWGGCFEEKDIEGLTYEESIKKYKEHTNG